MTPAPALTFGLDHPHGPALRAAAIRLKDSISNPADRPAAFEAWLEALASNFVYHGLPPDAVHIPTHTMAVFGDLGPGLEALLKLAATVESRQVAALAALKAVRDLPRERRPSAFLDAVKAQYACLLDQGGKANATPGRRAAAIALGVVYGLAPADAERIVDDAITLARCEWEARNTGYNPVTPPVPDLAPDTVVTGSTQGGEGRDAMSVAVIDSEVS